MIKKLLAFTFLFLVYQSGAEDPHSGIIEGDYNNLSIADLDSQPVKTMYLNNPNQHQLPGAPDEGSRELQARWQKENWIEISPADFNAKVIQDLLRLSELSQSGLKINSHLHSALARLVRLMPLGALTELNETGDDYYDRDGWHYAREDGNKVFLVKTCQSRFTD